MFFFFVCCCFFQAEDGIRDLVRSRGLGDVYKRQGQHLAPDNVVDGVGFCLAHGAQALGGRFEDFAAFLQPAANIVKQE